MSCGERSCKYFGDCSFSVLYACDVNCPHYEWDGKTNPDSSKLTKEEIKKILDGE